VAFRKGLCDRDYRAQLGKTCTECSDPVLADELCTKHYWRQKRYGDVDAVTFVKGDDEARFWSQVDRRGDDECWPWTGYIEKKGYGIFRMPDRPYPAHRWAYDHFVARIPDEMTVDHVKDRGCTRKDCVNFLAHLEVVTRAENTMRSGGAGAVNARKTHCIRKHEFTPSNTMVRKNGGRTCRACKKLREQGLLS
jgi:hypothetical protein